MHGERDDAGLGEQPWPEAELLAGSDDLEVLEHDGGRRWSRRALLVVTVTLALVGATTLGVDQLWRHHEASAVAACVTSSNAAIDLARGPVDAMVDYTRPTLSQVAEPQTRRMLWELVAERARGKAAQLRTDAAQCASVRVRWPHDDLRRRRDACRSVVDAQARRLESIASDGQAAFGPEPPRRCV